MTDIHFYLNNEEIEFIIKKFGIDKIDTKFIKSVLFAEITDSLDNQLKIARLEKIKLDNEYRKLQIKYFLLFKNEPSNQGNIALFEKAQKEFYDKNKTVFDKIEKENAQSYTPPEETKPEHEITTMHTWNYFLKELRMINDTWNIECKCKVSFLEQKSRESAIERLKTHLIESHLEEYAH